MIWTTKKQKQNVTSKNIKIGHQWMVFPSITKFLFKNVNGAEYDNRCSMIVPIINDK